MSKSRQRSTQPVPEALAKRGIVAAVEILPGPGDYTPRDAGRSLGQMFRRELCDRLFVKPETHKGEVA